VGTGSPSDNATKLMSVDKLAIGGVNAGTGHFATARQQCQHVDETVAAVAQPGPQELAMAAMPARQFDRLGEPDSPVAGYRRTLFGLVETGPVWRICGGRPAWGASLSAYR
jgi:hypothetical protein